MRRSVAFYQKLRASRRKLKATASAFKPTTVALFQDPKWPILQSELQSPEWSNLSLLFPVVQVEPDYFYNAKMLTIVLTSKTDIDLAKKNKYDVLDMDILNTDLLSKLHPFNMMVVLNCFTIHNVQVYSLALEIVRQTNRKMKALDFTPCVTYCPSYLVPLLQTMLWSLKHQHVIHVSETLICPSNHKYFQQTLF